VIDNARSGGGLCNRPTLPIMLLTCIERYVVRRLGPTETSAAVPLSGIKAEPSDHHDAVHHPCHTLSRAYGVYTAAILRRNNTVNYAELSFQSMFSGGLREGGPVPKTSALSN
jgi:hypothetical protein